MKRLLAALVAAVVLAECRADTADPRKRAYVDPVRVVWQSAKSGGYGQRFAVKDVERLHSLCHGWSCGPAQWCINNILGIRPLDPGCRRVEVKPFLGDLEWAEGAMASWWV